jgi:molecular chaperone DnaK
MIPPRFIRTGQQPDISLTPLSLSLETKGGVFAALIECYTTIPSEKKDTVTTAEDDRAAVTINVYHIRGIAPIAADNRRLGEFNLEGIPPSPIGTPQIEVSF